MVLENPLPPFGEWLSPALMVWAAAVVVVCFGILLLTALTTVLRYGPATGLRRTKAYVFDAALEPTRMSLVRVLALAQLAVREAVRNRVLVAFAVFALLLMFGGWFLSGGTNEAHLFLESIFLGMPFLAIMVTLLLSCYSLPNDIRQKTIYTLVTKPVRPSEIVLGRVLGFTAVGTLLLAVMGLIGYVFVARMVDHTHAVIPEEATPVDLPLAGGKFTDETIVERGRLAVAGIHFHRYSLAANGLGRTDDAAGHWHVIETDPTPHVQYARTEPGDTTRVQVFFTQPMDPVAAQQPQRYELSGGLRVLEAHVTADNRRVTLTASGQVAAGQTTVRVSPEMTSRIGRPLATTGPVTISEVDVPRDVTSYVVHGPEDVFRVRVPAYGTLRYLDRLGKPVQQATNVGYEWEYRSYIEGATQAAAIWTFDGVTAENYGDVLPLELTLRVYRTHKGRIDRTIRGTITLRNPDHPQVATLPRQFSVKDGTVDQQYCPRSLKGLDGEGRRVDLDLYRDLSAGGRIEVVVQCLESGQFFGMAPADAYLRAREGSFAANYVKTCLAVWFPLVLIAGVGVMCSTALSWPVAVMATATALVAGYFFSFIAAIAADKIYGGGPIEAAVRLNRQMNLVQPLEPGFTTDVIKWCDGRLRNLMQVVVNMVPDFSAFPRDKYLTGGFQIPADHLWILCLTTLGYLLPVMFVGYVLLKSREVAR